MSLKAYRSKRHFKETTEPRGKVRKEKGSLKFFIQKHAARRLHYDLRLELDGVLKSWAVPKGPSLKPKDKRLAIHVEDHPLEYGTFEGTIPPGHYGAGTVEVWDKGTYAVAGDVARSEQERSIRRQLEAGELKFFFHGTRMHGEYVLVRLASDPTGKQWLLIKKQEAVPREPVKLLADTKAPKAEMPHLIKPMLAYLVEEPFDHPDWLFEIKWDGYRAIAEITPQKVELYSRNFISFNEKFPAIVKSLQQFNESMILDGEIVILDAEGRSQFQLLQNYLNERIAGSLKYCVFDLLYYKDRDLRHLPLIERKKLLKQIIESASPPDIIFSDHIDGQGKAFFKELSQIQVEGMVAKEKSSSYLSARSKHWLKIKVHKRQEVVIVGYTAPKGSRKEFGALVLGVYENGQLSYAGLVGTGFNQHSLKEIAGQLQPLAIDECPFKHMPKISPRPTWVKPELVCEVSFQEWTKDNLMRQPVFEGLRSDKAAKKVVREKSIPLQEQPQKDVKQEKNEMTTAKKSSKQSSVMNEIITHPEKVFWPHEGYTKKDLLDYYVAIAPFLLPHLKDRPMTLHRYPDGIEGADFYQKEAPEFIPDWLHTARVEQSKKEIRYILIKDIKDLLYVANSGSIELHPFLSRYPHVDYPDFLVLDIDPVDLPFDATIEVSKEVHKILKKLEVDHYCKTSGKRGMHLYIPLNGKYAYEPVEALSKLLAFYIHQSLPDITSVVRDPAKRQKKVYVDYLQNGRTKTVVSPYSVRPVEGATVSAPLDWKEVKKGLDPHDFTILNMPARVKKKGDLFKPVLGKGIDMRALLKKLDNVA